MSAVIAVAAWRPASLFSSAASAGVSISLNSAAVPSAETSASPHRPSTETSVRAAASHDGLRSLRP